MSVVVFDVRLTLTDDDPRTGEDLENQMAEALKRVAPLGVKVSFRDEE